MNVDVKIVSIKAYSFGSEKLSFLFRFRTTHRLAIDSVLPESIWCIGSGRLKESQESVPNMIERERRGTRPELVRRTKALRGHFEVIEKEPKSNVLLVR